MNGRPVVDKLFQTVCGADGRLRRRRQLMDE